MIARSVAVVVVWAVLGATVVGTAFAWGAQGRTATVLLGAVLGFCALGATSFLTAPDKGRGTHDDPAR